MSAFRACACSAVHLVRVPRRRWMRLLFWLRAYRCSECGKVQLRSEKAVRRAKAAG